MVFLFLLRTSHRFNLFFILALFERCIDMCFMCDDKKCVCSWFWFSVVNQRQFNKRVFVCVCVDNTIHSQYFTWNFLFCSCCFFSLNITLFAVCLMLVLFSFILFYYFHLQARKKSCFFSLNLISLYHVCINRFNKLFSWCCFLNKFCFFFSLVSFDIFLCFSTQKWAIWMNNLKLVVFCFFIQKFPKKKN